MKHQLHTRIRYSEIDENGNLNIVSLINYLQDCAAFHSDAVGYGLDHLKPQHTGWFITNWQLLILKLPRYGEEITISTWAYSMRGMIAKRNFSIENAAGEPLVLANSFWVFMDLAAAKPVRIPDADILAYQVEEGLDLPWGNRKIAPFPEAAYTSLGSTQVMPVHLDTNHHMNNAYYIEIARDSLPKGRKIFGIRAEYKKPAALGDRILIRYAEATPGDGHPRTDASIAAEMARSGFETDCAARTQVLLENDEQALFAAVEFWTD